MSTPNQLSMLPKSKLIEAPSNYRKVYPKTEMEELTESIRKNGIISPITVRKNSKGLYEVVAGSRRFKAGTAAELEEFPVVIRELTDNQVLEIQLIENVQRQDPHPMEEAEAFKQAIELLNYTVQELALRVSKSDSYIQQRLKLNDLTDAFKKMLYEDRINLSHAIQLCRISPKDQDECHEDIYDWGGDHDAVITPSALKTWIQHNVTLNLDSSSFDKQDATLNPKAGSCNKCPNRSGYNTSLFNDIEEKDRCFNKDCYSVKISAHIDKKIVELKTSGQKFYKVSTSTSPSEEIKKKFPDLVIAHTQFKKIDSKKEMCKSAETGFVVYGNGDLGEIINICTDKLCTKHWGMRDYSSTKHADPVKAAEARIERHRELDGEKIQEKISEALLTDPTLTATDQDYLKSELVGMMMLVFENASFEIRGKIMKHLKWGKSFGDSMDSFHKNIKTSTAQQRAFITRMILIDKYKSVINPADSKALILKELAIEKGLPVAQIEADQEAIKVKREEKAKARLKELQLEEKKAKEEASGKKNKKGTVA